MRASCGDAIVGREPLRFRAQGHHRQQDLGSRFREVEAVGHAHDLDTV